MKKPDPLLRYSITTPLMVIRPDAIQVIPCGASVMKHYQAQMSRAIWRPAFGRKLGFLVTHNEALLGLIFLATPVARLTARDRFLFPNAPKNFKYGEALRSYMDMSVCVAAQPIGWHCNIGKLLAMIAPTLGDFVEAAYGDIFKGITTTSINGGNKATQYTRIYKYLGKTEGFGHENVDDATFKKMVTFLRAHCPHCNEGPVAEWLIPKPSPTQTMLSESPSLWCVVPGCRWFPKNHPRLAGLSDISKRGDGASPRVRRIAAFFKAIESLGVSAKQVLGTDVMGTNAVEITKKNSREHCHKRGVYYHAAIPPEQRPTIIQEVCTRWVLPRYERTKLLVPPYQSGAEGGRGIYK